MICRSAQTNAALEMVAAGRVLGGTGNWVLAGADGSIHILSADGKPLDQFNTGAAISGLTVAPIDGGALIVATDKGIDASRWKSKPCEQLIASYAAAAIRNSPPCQGGAGGGCHCSAPNRVALLRNSARPIAPRRH